MPSNKFLKAFDTKQTKFRSSWLKNATKSVGITMGAALEEVAPNTVEIAKSGSEIARSVLSTLKVGKSGIERINDSNYSKIGKMAIRNAMDSIKTGKFGDGGNMFGMMDMGGGSDEGFSYGDDDIDSSSSLSLDGLSSISDQINRQSIAQIKTAQANMDTMISINSARMYQTQQISGEILSHITNIENSLASMVQFNNETMLKFVQASLGYYERTGAALTDTSGKEEEPEEKVRASSVFNNRRGGVNLGRYKEHIKRNLQSKLDEHGIGMVLDENTLQMLAADPIGIGAGIAARAAIDKFDKVSGGLISGIEDRISSAIPNALMSLTKLSDSNNPIARFIGDVFGLKAEKRQGSFKDIKINKGPIPFDGETKHAITSIITHELRSQTGYLKILADKAVGEDSEKIMKSNREFFNERTGRFERNVDVDLNIAKQVEEAVSSAFGTTKFGEEMSKFTSGITKKEDREVIEKAVQDMYMEMLMHDGDSLSLEDMLHIINQLPVPSKAQSILKDRMKKMATSNKTVFNTAGQGRLLAREASNDKFTEIRQNGALSYLEESSFMGKEGDDLYKDIVNTLREDNNKLSNNLNVDLIKSIVQEPDFFARAATDPKYAPYMKYITSFDKATSAEYDKLVKKGVKKDDRQLEVLRQKIAGSNQFKDIQAGASDMLSGSGAAVASASTGVKNYIAKEAKEIGGGIANVSNRFVGGLQSHTGILSRFLFGDQKNGTLGFFEGISKSFNDTLEKSGVDIKDKDKVGMRAGAGALTGAALAKLGLLPAILGGTGPIGGAIAGLTVTIATCGPMIKKALFGGDIKEFTDENGKKYSHKTKGLIGRIGSTVEANLINPIKSAAVHAIGMTALNIEHGILTPVKYLARFGTEVITNAALKAVKKIGSLGQDLISSGILGKIFGGTTKLGGGLISTGIRTATSVGDKLINIPGNALGSLLSIFSPELSKEYDAARSGYRAHKSALKIVDKNRRKHDENAKLIAKLTKGEYSEDTDEARAYLRSIDPTNYEKYFGKDENGNYKRKGQIESKDAEKSMKKLIGESGGKISIDPSAYDSSSQTAIYTARMVIMQEQLLRAFLGEKVVYGANDDATLAKGKHEKKEKKPKTDKQKRDEEKKAKGKKYIKNLYDRYERGEELTEEELSRLKNTTEYKKNAEELEFNHSTNKKQREADAEYDLRKGGDNNFFTKFIAGIKYRYQSDKINKERARHQEELLGINNFRHRAHAGHLGSDEGGEGFGGRGEDDRLQEELNRKEAENDRYRAELANKKAEEGKLAAIARGKTIDEIKEEKKEKEEQDWKDKILKAVQGVKIENEEQHKSWKDIFSKKGLLTAGLLLAAPLIIKALPGIISFVKDTAPKIIEGVTTVATTIGPVVMDVLSGIWSGVESILKFLGHDAENSKDTDKSGISNTSSAKAGLALNLGRVAVNSSKYAARDIAKKPGFWKGVRSQGLVKTVAQRSKAGKVVRINKNIDTVIGKGVEAVKYGARNLTTEGLAKNAANLEEAAYKMADMDPKKAEKLLNKSIKLSEKASAAGGNKLLDKVLKYVDDFYNFILEKFKKKFGNTAAASFKELGKDQVIKFCKKYPNKITTKIAERLSAGSTAGAATLGLSEVAFVTLGAVNGISGAAKLFHVPSDSVDATMRIIAGFFGAATGTTFGSIIDILNQIIYGATGFDFLNMLATVLYTGAMKIAGRDDKIEKLNDSKQKLNDEYDEYKNTEIEKAYQTQLKAGLIPKDTTLEEFIAGVQDGTYQAIYDSKADYIAKNHGALSDKIMKGLGKGWKTYKKGLSLALGSIETTYTDENGNTYKKNSDGNYDIITPDGENVGSVTKDMIPDSAKKSVKYSTGIQNSLALGKQFINNLATNEKTKNTVLGKGATIVKDTAKKVETFWNNVKEGGINFLKRKIDDKVVYRPVDNPLSYYKYNKGKDTFSWYNQDGELIEEDAKTYDEMMTLYSNGLVSRDSSLKGVTTATKTSIKNKIETLGNNIKTLWEKGTTGIANALEKAKTSVSNLAKSIFSGDTSTEETETTGGKGFGGRGALYSQNDSRWKNARYGGDGATMGDSGCGPTAVAMAMSDVTGKNISPMQMAGLAQATGDRDSTGTNWNFVGNAASMAGIPSTQVYSPSSDYIGSQLASGKEMILSGRTGGYGGGFGSAYTPAGHYIVGTGIDRNGIVTYKDPTTGGYGRIPLGMLSSETGSAWTFGGRGPVGVDWEPIPGGKADTTQVNGIHTADWEEIPKNEKVSLGRTITSNLNARPENTYNISTKNTKTNNDWISSGRIIDTSSTTSTNYRPDKGYAPEDRYKDNAEYQRWLDTIAYVKSYASKKQGSYSQSSYVTVTTSDGVDIKMRTDCSGFTTTCLIAYGAIPNGTSLTSNSYANKNNSTLKNSGFIAMDWPGWDELIPGDIIAINGHVEIFAKNEGKYHKVWNWGSSDSASNPGITNTGHNNGYTTVWRHPSAGAGGNISGSTDATVSGSTSEAKKSSGIGDWWDKITGAVSSFFSHTIGQMFSGGHEAWTPDLLNSDGTTAGSEAAENTADGSVNGSVAGSLSDGFGSVASGATPSTRSIFQKLLSKGLNNVAASGIMGNWQVESKNNPDRFEADYTPFAKDMGGTAGVFKDSESLNTFTNRLFENYAKNGKSVNQSAYKGTDGNLYPGMGLAQWTGPRGQQLLEFAKNKGKAWNTADTQIDFFMNGPSEFNSKSGLMDKMNNSQSPTDAANTFFDYFEMNNPGYNQRAPQWVNIADRRGYAEDFYSKFKDIGVFDTIDTTNEKSLNYIPSDVRNTIANNSGASVVKNNTSPNPDINYTDLTFDTAGNNGASIKDLSFSEKVGGQGGFGIGRRPGTGYYGPKYNPKSDGGYGYGGSTNTEAMIKEIVTLMYNLIDVESGASGKLDMLSNIKGTTNNTLIAGSDGGTLNVQSMGKHVGNEANSRNFNQAYKIATTI